MGKDVGKDVGKDIYVGYVPFIVQYEYTLARLLASTTRYIFKK